MSNKNSYLVVVLVIALFSTWYFSKPDVKNEGFSEKVKLSLRAVGHQLLLSNEDSTSLVLPVVALDKSKYQLSFQHELTFEPNSLVSIVEASFQKGTLPTNYLVEVIQCTDGEVAYSYEMINTVENSIIPCTGRFLSKNCYLIEVRFIDKTANLFGEKAPIYILIFGLFFLFQFILYKRKHKAITEEANSAYSKIGVFQFYPEQNKLVKEAVEISLSKKECELLSLFIAKPNQIIKREELEKKVWEDHGVFVGRSLDTYISKLRKKFKDDTTIKFTNVHGVGYKLEIKA